MQNLSNIFKEFYKRFIIPFYIPILSLIPFLLIITSKESSKYYKIRIVTFFIGILIIIFSETTIRFISDLTFTNITFIIIPIILFLFLYLFLFFNLKTNIKKN